MIEPQILYGVTCDRCGETLINSNDNSAWYDRSTAEEEASEEDWHSVSSHHYCPNCYREDDDGNRTIKAPFPYYVQKINRFMNRIAKSYPCRIVEEDDHFADDNQAIRARPLLSPKMAQRRQGTATPSLRHRKGHR